MTVSRVIYIVESPLSVRDFDRFGIDTLSSAGFTTEVWEVDELFLPREGAAEVLRPCCVTIRRITTSDELVRACQRLGNDVAVILISGVYAGGFMTHRSMINALGASDATLCAVAAGPRPPIRWGSDPRGWHARQLGRLTRQMEGIREGRTTTRELVRTGGLRALALGDSVSRRFTRRSTRCLDWLWVATDTDSIDSRFIGPQTRIRYVHTWDYDFLLRNPQLGSASPRPVYLDAMGPLHPDFEVLGMKVEVDAEEWFACINDGLTQVEVCLGQPVVVAAHPRAEPGSLEQWYDNREVRYGETASLVSSASIVLLSDPTTSLGIVVAFGRPALILRPPMLFDTHLLELDQYAEILGIRSIPVERAGFGWSWPIVDESAYMAYLLRYVKRQGTPDKPFWQVVARDLTASKRR